MTAGEPRDTTLRRLHMRSMRRGIKEMDLILARYAGVRLELMDASGLEHYDALLGQNDQDLYRWVTAQEEAPARFAALIAEIRGVATDHAGF